MIRTLKALCQKKMFLILLLGFASGLPLGVTGTTLSAWYTQEGLSVITIGFLGLIGQPYVFKFLWAPVVDKVSPPFWVQRRGWLVLLQAALAISIAVMGCFSPKEYPIFLGCIAFFVAILSATQDIVVDALRTEVLTEEERGLGTSMNVSGYRVAMLLSAGLSLVIAHHAGFRTTYYLLGLSMVIGMFATWQIAESKPLHNKKLISWLDAFRLPLKEFIARPYALGFIGILLLYKLGDAFAASLTTTFLLRALEFSLSEVGYINKTFGLAGVLAGTLVGGLALTNLSLWRGLMLFGILQAVTNLSYVVLAMVGHHLPLMVSAVFIENFAGGLGTAAFVAFLMSLCNKQFTASQFALFSAISSVGRVFVGPISGLMVESLGWTSFFIWSFVFSFPGLVVLYWVRQAGVFNLHEENGAGEYSMVK